MSDPGALRARVLDALKTVATTDPLPGDLTAASLGAWLGGPFAGFQPRIAPQLPHTPPAEAKDVARKARQAFNRGQAFLLGAQPRRAAEQLTDALQLAIQCGNAEIAVAALAQSVAAEADSGATPKALAASLEAYALLETAPDPEREGHLLLGLALVMIRQGLHARAVELSARAIPGLIDEDDGLVAGLARLSDAYRMSGDNASARQISELAIAASEHAAPFYRVAAVLPHAACLYRDGELDEALSLLDTLEANPDLSDAETSIRCETLRSSIHQAAGRVSLALDAAHRARDRAWTTNSTHLPATESQLAGLYLDLDDPKAALSHARASIQAAKVRGTFRIDQAPYLLIVQCYRSLGHWEEAATAVNTLSLIYRTANSAGILWCNSEKAELEMAVGKVDAAVDHLKDAVSALEGSFVPFHWSDLYLKLAAAHWRAGNYDAATEALERFDQFQPDGPRGILLPTYYVLRAALAHNPQDEIAILREGIDRVEHLRLAVPLSLRRQGPLLAAVGNIFERLLEIDRSQSPGELYRLCQRARGRHFVSLLSRSELRAPPAVDPAYAQEEADLLGKLRATTADLAHPDRPELEGLDQREHDRVVGELEKIWSRMEADVPAYVELRRGTIGDIQQLIAGIDPDAHRRA